MRHWALSPLALRSAVLPAFFEREGGGGQKTADLLFLEGEMEVAGPRWTYLVYYAGHQAPPGDILHLREAGAETRGC